jgi:hypothetical protein
MAPESLPEINIVSGGHIVCPACGASVTRTTGSCPACGASLDASRVDIRSGARGAGETGLFGSLLRLLGRPATRSLRRKRPPLLTPEEEPGEAGPT